MLLVPDRFTFGGVGSGLQISVLAVGMECEMDWNGGGVGESVVDSVAKTEI